jgi:hypothetical protein
MNALRLMPLVGRDMVWAVEHGVMSTWKYEPFERVNAREYPKCLELRKS